MKEYKVLYEDSEILVIVKPWGQAVQGGVGISNPVIDNIDRIYSRKHYLIHRLDKDTEGILIIGKNSTSAAKYSKILNSPLSTKEYIAVVSGTMKENRGMIKIPLEKNGKTVSAVSRYRVLETKSDFSKLSVKIDTGRMHQIRIHLAQSGCPIVADDKYGNFKLNKALKKEFGAKKLMLAAVKLELRKENEKEMIFTCPVPDHIVSFWEKITKI